MNTFTYLKILVTILSISFIASGQNEKIYQDSDIQIIPRPAHLKLGTGEFTFSKSTIFVASNESQKEIFILLADKFKKASGWNLEIVKKATKKNYIEFVVDEKLESEAYNLEVNSERVIIKANGNAGFIYGLESIRQLLPSAIESPEIVNNTVWAIPNIEIQDKPRFQWRGLMLDLSRHFFDKHYIKETIDALALHKMNILHLHLVDDQGWRIEIKKYPKLTEVGAWRVDQEDKAWNARDKVDPNEKGTYGGFLTQEELKEIVAYGLSKNVEIVPEIEMPAHVSSAIAAYPELSCFDAQIGVPSGGVWPITDIYCAGKDSTFQFLENVLNEVIDIFPSKYIHIGGDEATKTNWKTCTHCQERMKTESLASVDELQSYFVKRMEKYINSKGKKLIGWDEILEGGLAPDATVMSWRGVKGGLEAAEQGHDVVMTPGTHCYFDHYQGPQNEEPLAIGGFTPLSKVYLFDPIVESMTPEEAEHVLGGQANLWAEYIPTEEQSQYMIFPRLAALSETLWSKKESRDWDNFTTRIKNLFERYDYLGINYAKSAYLVTANTEVDIESKTVKLTLQNEFPNADIRYVLGNESLEANAIKYATPITLRETTNINASLFKDNKPVGNLLTNTIIFHKGVAKMVTYAKPYHDKYQGAGAFNMVNTLRGTKNFSDGQWQAWLNDNMEAIIDLDHDVQVSQVTVGALQNQGPDIYLPTSVEIYTSNDGENFTSVGKIENPLQKDDAILLKEFKISFNEQLARYIKVKATNLKDNPRGGGTWLFVDEIIIE